VERAGAIVRSDGLDALTMRRLAEELGVTVKALYNHAPNKAAVLQAVVDRVWADIFTGLATDSSDLVEWLVELQLRTRRIWLDNIELAAFSMAVSEPDQKLIDAAVLSAVVGRAVGARDVGLLYNVLQTYTFGSIAVAANRRRASAYVGRDPAQALAAAYELAEALGAPPEARSIIEAQWDEGDERHFETGLRILNAGFLVAVLEHGGGVVELAAVSLALTVVKAGVFARVALRSLPALHLAPRHADCATLRLIGGYSLRAFVIMIAGRIEYRSDALVIGAFLAPRHITYFCIAARLTESAKDALRVVTAALTPAISALDARGRRDEIQAIYLGVTRGVLWVVLPIVCGLIVLGKPFLAVWAEDGTEYGAEDPQEGTWRAEGGKRCGIAPGETEETCSTPGELGEDGTFEAVRDDGTKLIVRPID